MYCRCKEHSTTTSRHGIEMFKNFGKNSAEDVVESIAQSISILILYAQRNQWTMTLLIKINAVGQNVAILITLIAKQGQVQFRAKYFSILFRVIFLNRFGVLRSAFCTVGVKNHSATSQAGILSKFFESSRIAAAEGDVVESTTQSISIFVYLIESMDDIANARLNRKY